MSIARESALCQNSLVDFCGRGQAGKISPEGRLDSLIPIAEKTTAGGATF